MSFLEVSSLTIAFLASSFGGGKLLGFLSLLNNLQFFLMFEIDHCHLLNSEREVVPTLFANESIHLLISFYEKHLKAERTEIHVYKYYKQKSGLLFVIYNQAYLMDINKQRQEIADYLNLKLGGYPAAAEYLPITADGYL